MAETQRPGLAVYAPDMAGDELFDDASPRNRDGWFDGYHQLRRNAVEAGWDCHTHDWFQDHDARPEVVLYLDIPPRNVARIQRGWADRARAWVVLQESELIVPRNWSDRRQAQFQRVFTWHEDYFGRPGYRRLNFSVPLDRRPGRRIPFADRRLCTMIAGNKRIRHPLELYTARVEVIKWFERHQPDDFDLFGMGWDRFVFPGPRPVRALNVVRPLGRMLAREHPTYRGPVDRKIDVLPRYRFAICFENARDIPGYITEKLLECFTAGVVPVYRGPANIADIVRPDAFLDMRDFPDLPSLHARMKGMDAEEHDAYLAAADEWLRSPAAEQFTPRHFGATIARELTAVS